LAVENAFAGNQKKAYGWLRYDKNIVLSILLSVTAGFAIGFYGGFTLGELPVLI